MDNLMAVASESLVQKTAVSSKFNDKILSVNRPTQSYKLYSFTIKHAPINTDALQL